MSRPITRKAHNKCADCGTSMNEVIYIRPFAKLCDDCKNDKSYAHAQVKKIFRSFKKNPTTPAPDEMFFEDDPRAEKEQMFGRVNRIPTTIDNNVNILERNYHVL